jgi:acyl-CoA synthetase (AMP-forming)/AMP-acid ligase II
MAQFLRRISGFFQLLFIMNSSVATFADPYQLLLQHARSQPDAIAYSSRWRVATWRKLRNRIERSAARLYGEWGVRPGDLVAYLGCGHPDALVLYFGLLCCGARLLPLEHEELQAASARILDELRVKLVLIDDDAAPPARIAAHTLSALIGSPTQHPALTAPPDARLPSLVRVAASAGSFEAVQTSLADEACLAPAAEPCAVKTALFDADNFPRVLATLAGGGIVAFEA